jgi:hypothetical protein
VLEHFQGELYCPDCVSFTIPAEPPPGAVRYTASTTGGSYVHEGGNLEALLEWCRGLLGPGEPPDDIVVSAGPFVYAVLRGDGRTVRVR